MFHENLGHGLENVQACGGFEPYD